MSKTIDVAKVRKNGDSHYVKVPASLLGIELERDDNFKVSYNQKTKTLEYQKVWKFK